MGTRRGTGRRSRGWWHRLLVLAGLAGFVGSVYVVVVLGGGALIGRTESPSLLLSVLATATVAVLFNPAHGFVDRTVNRLVHGAAATPYDVLSRFSEATSSDHTADELPARMSMLLAQGTGAAWAQVWLTVADRLTLAATWPSDTPAETTPPCPQDDARDASGVGRRALLVRYGDEKLGVLRVQERPGMALTAVEERLFSGLAAQAGLVLRLARLRADLEGRREELLGRAEELKVSRARLIETQDQERRRLERDIHDGAQQHLVALAVNLRLAHTVAGRSSTRAAAVLAEQVGAAENAIETLTLLSRGIYPRLLSDEGLAPALVAAVSASAIPVTVRAAPMARLPGAIEAALYFCCMEAVQNAAKHSGAGLIEVRLDADHERCTLVVTDDGIGFEQAVADDRAGVGLLNMHDRLDSVGGRSPLPPRRASARRSRRWPPWPTPPIHVSAGRRRRSCPGRAEMHARIAWSLFGLTTLAVVLDTGFTAAHRSLWSEATWADHGWPLAPLASLGCALMGALIVSRYPRHRLGWLLSGASLLSVTLAVEAYSAWVIEADGPGSAESAQVMAWAAPLLGWPAFTALIMVFLISPDGHLPSRRWRWAGWTAVVGLGLHTVGTLTTRPSDFVDGEQYHQSPLSTLLLTIGYLLVAAGLVASVASLVVRLRRSRDDVRRQVLWIGSSAAFLALGVIVILAVPRLQGEEGTWLAGLPLRIAQVSVPLCVAVAVLRHRLLEIDLIINRAVMLALATALAAGGYVLVVVVVGRTVGAGGFWTSLVATALVALGVQPLRRRVVRVADRLAFGSAAAPYEALADFSRRLGESPDPATLLPGVAEAAARAVNARRVTVQLHVQAGPDLRAVWPSASAAEVASHAAELPAIQVPVIDRGERLGVVTVEMPLGLPLRARDQQLLADLADQAGRAFRHARLTAELSGHVDQLRMRTDDLAESRRRLITAGDAERSRLERAIALGVVPHLTPLPGRLRRLSRADHDPSLDPPMIGPLVESLTAALEALREITRGVFPAQLARSGLPSALGSLLARPASAGRLEVAASATGRRFDPGVEAAAYFCVAEAARDLAGPVRVVLRTLGDELHLQVTGTHVSELDLRHLTDRVEAVGGTVSVTSSGGRTRIDLLAPAGPGPRPDPLVAVATAVTGS